MKQIFLSILVLGLILMGSNRAMADADPCATTITGISGGGTICNGDLIHAVIHPATGGTVTCTGPKGAVTLTADGSSGDYQIHITPSTAADAGTYTVHVTGGTHKVGRTNVACGPIADATFTVTVVTVAPPVLTIINNCNGTSTITATGVTCSLVWSGSCGSSITGSGPYTVHTAGTYTATQKSGSCTSSASNSVTAAPHTAPTVTTCNATICASGSSTNNSVSLTGSPAGGTWNVSNPYSNATAGTYTGIYTYTDAHGCSNSATSHITVNAAPSVSASDATICASGSSTHNSVSLSATPTGGTWNVSNPYSNATAGTYTGIYTYANSHGCTSSATSHITVNAAPSVSAGDASICASGSSTNNSVSLTGSPTGGTWNVSNPYSNATAGTYTGKYTYLDGNGCTSSATNHITVNAAPSVSASDATVCVSSSSTNNSVSLVGSPAGGTWNVPNPYSNAIAGTYTGIYTYTDGNGCSNSATSHITVNAAPSVSASDATICASGSSTHNSVSLLATPTGGTWNVSNPYSNATAGAYTGTYTYTNGNGCTSSATNNIIVNAAPSVSASDATVCASGSSTGNSVSLTGLPAGGSWDVSNPYSNATAGTYTGTYTYTDGNGCTSAATNTITVNAAPSVSATDATICASGSSTHNSVSLLATPTGGSWDVANPYSNAIAGAYPGTYTYTDGNGCTSAVTNTITVNAAPSVSASDATVCASGSSTGNSVSLTGLPAGGSWDVSNPYSNATAGAYTGTYTYTNGNGCTSSATNTITVNTAPSVSASDATVCASGSSTGNSVSLTGLPAGGSWDVSNPYSNATAGAYTGTYTYTDGNGCTSSATNTITVNATPSVSASDATVCASGSSTGNSVSLTGLPAGGSWDVSNPYSNATAGAYTGTYTYTDGNGCTSSATNTITVNAAPSVSASDATVCASGSSTGNSVSLTGLPAGGSWDVSNPYSNATAGAYTGTYTYTDGNGCTSSATNTITVNATPSVSASDATVCASGSSTGNSVSLTGLPAGGSWDVSNPYSNATAGAYTGTYTYTDGNGCTSSATNTITVNAAPSVTASDATVCASGSSTGNSVSLTGLPAGGSWDVSNPYSNATAGAYTGTYTYTDGNGCTSSATNTITVNATPSVSASDATVCASGSSTGNSVSLTGLPAGGSWDVSNPYSNATAGAYTGTYTYTNGNGCTSSATNTITVNTAPSVSASDATVCASGSSTGNSVSLTGLPAGGSWDVSNPYSNATAGAYTGTYTYTDGNGCTSSATNTITVNATPSVSASDATVCASGSSTGNSVSLTGLPAGGSWDVSNPYSNATAGAYTGTYTYTDGNGCTSSATNTITVNAAPSVTASDATVCASGSSTGNSVSLTGLPAGGSWDVSNPYSNATAGAYTGTYTYTDGNGCTSSATNTITVNATPSVSASDATVCASGSSTGNSVSLTGLPAGGSWDVSNPYSNATAGAYPGTYTYTDGNGCTSSATNNITVNAAPSVSASDATVCASGSSTGNSVSLTGLPAGGSWDVPNPYSNLTAGAYPGSYTYTDGNGCTSSATNNITVNAAPSVSASDATVCASGSSTNNSVSLTGLPAGGSWDVSNPYSNATAGAYTGTYTYTDGNGCTSSATNNITVNAAPSVSASDATVCASGSSANNSVSLTGLPAGGSWDVSNPYSNLTAGAYPGSYTYTDGNGCTSSATNNITVNAAPSVSASDATVCASGSSTGNSVSLTGLPAGGSWDVSNPYSTATAGAYPGTYTYTDGNGCTSSATNTITVNAAPSVSASDATVCTSASVSLTGLPAGGSWNVSNPYTNATAGAYPGTYTYTDGNGCTSSATNNITVNATPSVSASNATVCASGSSTGNSVSLTGLPTGGAWNVSNPYSNATAGAYTGTYTYTNAHGCTSSATNTITVNAAPSVTASNTSVCTGSSVSLTGSPAGGTWNVSNPYSKPTAGTYTGTYTYTDANGCSGNAISHITVNAAPSVTASNATVCAGSSVSLTGSPTGGTWNVSNPYSNATAGTYTGTYTYTAVNGCTGSAISHITVKAAPSVTASNASVCTGSSVCLTGSPTGGTWNVSNPYSNATAGTYTGTYTYTAVNGCTGSAISHITVHATPSVTASNASVCTGSSVSLTGSPAGGTWNVPNPYSKPTAGTYTGTYTYTDVNGCTGSAISHITVHAAPCVTTCNASVCTGSSVCLTGSPAGGTWNVSNPYSKPTAGTYTGTYTYTDVNGCTGSAISHITVNATPSVSVTASVAPAITNGTEPAGDLYWGYQYEKFVATVTGGTHPYTYSWSADASSTTSTKHYPTSTGSNTYSETVTVTDAKGCVASSSNSATVNVYDERCGTNKINICHYNSSCPSGWHTICVSNDETTVDDQMSEVHSGRYNYCGVCDAAREANTTGVNNTTVGTDAVKVYPNPTTGILNVEIPTSDKDAQIQILDVTGRVIATQLVSANTTTPVEFNLGNVPNGMYMVKVNLDGDARIVKLIKN